MPLGYFMLVVGAATLVTALAGSGFATPGLPPVLKFTGLFAGCAEILLGIGVLRRSAASWAFAVSIVFTLLLVDLLGAPQMLRGGVGGKIALALAVLRTIYGVLLIAAQEEFRGKPET
jgi:hypothetical protein